MRNDKKPNRDAITLFAGKGYEVEIEWIREIHLQLGSRLLPNVVVLPLMRHIRIFLKLHISSIADSTLNYHQYFFSLINRYT